MLRILFGLIIAFAYLISISVSTFPLDIPRKLWVFWDSQIEKAPIIVQLCVQKMRVACQKQNWTLIVLNQTNLHEHIPNYENQFMQVRNHAAHPQWKAALSDLVRLNVIAANGGVYMDITTILIEGMDWLDRLDQVPYLLTNSNLQKGEQPEAIVPYIAFYQNSGETRDSEGRITNWLPGYEAWFLAAKKNATFIQKWRLSHQKHFQLPVPQNGKEQIEKGYFLRHNLGGDYLIVDKSAFEVIQDEQAKLDRHLTLFSQRKNVNKELKILGLHGEFGPFSLYLGYTPREEDFFTMTIHEVQTKYYTPIHFFVKLTNNHRKFFDRYFEKLKEISDKFGHDSKVFERFMASTPKQSDCNTVKFIVEGSVFGQLVRENPKAEKEQIFTITVDQRDKFYMYCKKIHNIELKEVTLYDNLYYYISRLIQMGEVVNLVYPWAKYKFDEYLKEKFRESILPPRNWMGWLIQPAQTIYWERIYQKKLREEGPLPEINQLHGLAQIFSDQSSQLQLTWMRIKMFFFVHRVQILTCVLHWIGFLYLFTLFGLSYIAVQLSLWLLNSIYKYNIRPFVWIRVAVSKPEMVLPAKRLTYELVKKVKNIYFSMTPAKAINLTLKSFKFILYYAFTLTIGLLFFAYYTYILYYYDVVINNGKIYEQEWIFLSIISIQIFFRYVGSKIGQNTWILPGLQFRFAYYMFLPVYYYMFGSVLLSLVRPFENQNFAISYYIAFCMALLVKLIEHQSRNGMKKIILKPEDKENYPKIFLNQVHLIASNLTGWMQKAVIAFLIAIMVTNLRFLKNSEGYILPKFFQLLAKTKFTWFVLFFICGVKCYLQIVDAVRNTIKMTGPLNHPPGIEQSQTNINSQIDPKPARSSTSLFSEQINTRVKWVRAFFFEAGKSLVILTKLILRIYTMHILLFNQYNDYMIRHVFQINFDHTFMKITFMCAFWAIVFINFLVELYLEEEYFSILKEFKPNSNTLSFDVQEPLNEDLRIAGNRSNENEDESLRQGRSRPNYKNVEVVLSLCQIVMFIIPRLMSIMNFMSFFNPMNNGVKFEKKNFQQHMIIMLYAVVFGYGILQPLLRKWMKYIHSKSNPLELNGENQLLPEEDGQIELKERRLNHE